MKAEAIMTNMRMANVTRKAAVLALVLCGGLLVGACPDTFEDLPFFNNVRVVLINDTDFDVYPDIDYDDDSSWLADWFPAETLSVGRLEPGETATYNFDCDELGSLASDESDQEIPLFGTYTADASRTLKRDDDYGCGDTIRFRFVGEGDDFGVVVSVNLRVVD
jgi:hypothetical protein